MTFSSFQMLKAVVLSIFALSVGDCIELDYTPLNHCGRSYVTQYDSENSFNYTFYCPNGAQCVNGMCQDSVCKMPTHYAGALFNLQNGLMAENLVDRCSVSSGECLRNVNLYHFCGFNLSLADGMHYYFNCEGYCNAAWALPPFRCHHPGDDALITQCNAGGLQVRNGKCQGNCSADVVCNNVAQPEPRNPSSLRQCGQQNNASVDGAEYSFNFECPRGYDCVEQTCRACNGSTVPSVVSRCNIATGECSPNHDLASNCDYSLGREDGFTYYFNCASGSCSRAKCLNYNGQVIAGDVQVTQCAEPGLGITRGQCNQDFCGYCACPRSYQCETYRI